MESYSKPAPSGIMQVTEDVEEEGAVATATLQTPSAMKLILGKMEWMETQLKELQQTSANRGWGRRRTGSQSCWKCGETGHLMKACPTLKVSPGNEKPLEL